VMSHSARVIFSDNKDREEMEWKKIKNWRIISGQLKQIFEIQDLIMSGSAFTQLLGKFPLMPLYPYPLPHPLKLL